ncbi:MAG: pseudouridine synthase, RluD [Belnapia sp.]|nr:pseudouridine synthase, RluD [Belnapia sp.]
MHRSARWPSRFRLTPARLSATGLLAGGLLLAACAWQEPRPPSAGDVPWSLPAEAAATLPQGWDPALAARFHFGPQGSRLIPRTWFAALETADGAGRFAAPEHLARYGLLYAGDAGTGLNPDRLPIGFAIDPSPQPATGNWVGLTCAACHTNEVTHRGSRLRIDGAPASFDFDSFSAALDTAVQATNADPARLAALAARLGVTPEALREPFANFATRSARQAAIQAPANPAGFARVDALGQIINAIAALDLDAPAEVQDANRRAPQAPVSYPHLWLTPQLDWVQWVPIAGSPIGRNAGEVLGVHGRVALGPPGSAGRFNTSVQYESLHAMESWISALKPPAWPEDRFGAIDRARWTEGKRIFAASCQGCHNMPPFRRTDPRDSRAGQDYIRVSAVPQSVVGTDPTYLRALAEWRIDPGPLADLFDGARSVRAPDYFGKTVTTVVLDNLGKQPLFTINLVDTGELRACPSGLRSTVNGGRAAIQRHEVASPCIIPRGQVALGSRPWVPPASSWSALKAGPLLGTWATGPFLHNGSVPSVYDLLSPVAERPAVFWTGGRELDVEKLGFVSAEAPGLFRFDTAAPANSNHGHAFPAQPLPPAQRLAVVEFLKDPLRFDAGGLR